MTTIVGDSIGLASYDSFIRRSPPHVPAHPAPIISDPERSLTDARTSAELFDASTFPENGRFWGAPENG
jgi:hypothetical protein